MVVLFILYCFFAHASLRFITDETVKRDELVFYITAERYTECLIVLLLTSRVFNFLELYDETSPLMDIIFKIFKDIFWFVVVFLVVIFAISTCFYLLG